jgi:hypothetical protein
MDGTTQHTFEVKDTIDEKFAVFVDKVRIAVRTLQVDAMAHCERLRSHATGFNESFSRDVR